MLKNTKIFFKLLGSFMIIILMVFGFGIAAIKYIASMSDITSQLYRHPFTVATEVLKANVNIIAMHQSMKDVVLAENEASVQEAINLVNSYENSVYQSFGLVKERFLGDSAQIERVLVTIGNWRPIRQQVIDLIHENRQQEAIAITHGEGLRHLEQIRKEMNALLEFAEAKALDYMNQGLNKGRRAIQMMSVFLIIVFATAAAIAIIATLGITMPLARIIQQMKLISLGEPGKVVTDVGRRDELGDLAVAAESFNQSVQNIQQLNSDLQQQHWVRSSISELMRKIQVASSSVELFDSVISYIVRSLSGGHGVFYHYEEDQNHLRLVGTFGLDRPREFKQIVALGEGLIGQCAKECQPITLEQIPENYALISSGLGAATPRQLAIIPIVFNEQLLGVIEIASFTTFSEKQQQFINQLMPVLALNLANFLVGQKTIDLLKTTMQQAEKLRTSEDELKKAAGELKKSNEELRENTELLNSQSQELKASEEELRVINEELSIKNQLLDHQKDELELASTEAEKRAEELSRINRYKSEFLANMSHELRTPLNSLLILSRSMATNESGDLNTEHIESARIIYESASELLRIINDVLDLSKIEAGKVDVVPELCLTSEFADSLKRQFSHMAARKEIGLDIVIDEQVPTEFVTDHNKLRQILVNLLSNAIKFTRRGSVTLNISVHCAKQRASDNSSKAASDLVFEVKDTGIGIPPTQIKLIFEEFRQVNGTTNRIHEGTGLGLAIASRMARLLRGTISVKSTEKQGSEFTLSIPLESAGLYECHQNVPLLIKSENKKPDNHDLVNASVSLQKAAKSGQCSVLVIENDWHFAKTLFDAIVRVGLDFLHADSGEKGLRLALTHHPVGILIDVNLPDIDGFEVIAKLSAEATTRHIPVHIISGEGSVKIPEIEFIRGYLSKPVTPEQIDSAVDRLLAGSESNSKKLLVVEDDENARDVIGHLVKREHLLVTGVSSAEEALALLCKESFDCMILDLGLPGMSGFDFLARANAENLKLPPVIIYSGRELTKKDSLLLRSYTDSVVIKGDKSGERLLDEVSLFLHNIIDTDQRESLAELATSVDESSIRLFQEETILIVDDDMRHIFALSKTLRSKGLRILMAKDGEHAMKQIARTSQVDLIVMDIMMPGMDGYDTIKLIRGNAQYTTVPIIAVTARAMPGDRQKSLAAGANDYLAKPVVMDELIQKIRHWLGYDK